MNWGHGLIIFFGAFVLLMISLVVICVRQDDIHLVTQNYYEEEINYQQQIEKIANAKDLDYDALAYEAASKQMHLNLPQGAEGTLHLFRPSDARLDQKIPIKMQKGEAMSIDLAHLQPGYWRVKLNWQEGGTAYYLEEQISL
ncbi:MAG TPA: FixH family protein [Cyclobacteriaceae bacterium]|nr:FixH family protein [Cyclobacteriaceae bacterium]